MPQLAVREIRARSIPIPLTRPISSSLGTYTHVNCVVVTLHTDGGPTGTGFTMGLGGAWSRAVAAYVADELAPVAEGRDVLAPEALWNTLWAPNKARMRAGLGPWALSAIDIACWDVVAKAAGLPLHRLLGGFRDDVPVYGSGGWLDLSDEELVTEAEGFAASGISAYKYKVGSPRDLDRTRLLRRALGDDITLLADANQRFDVTGAVEMAAMLADFGVEWLEEPVLADTVDDLADTAARSPIPIAAGENAYFRWGFGEICERRAAAYLQPDVARCGGVTEFRKVAALAESYRLRLSSHLWHELSVSLVGASPAGWAAEYSDLLPEGLWTREFPVTDGRIRVPDVPGHGVEFDQAVLARLSE